jgi:hypothetical protein
MAEAQMVVNCRAHSGVGMRYGAVTAHETVAACLAAACGDSTSEGPTPPFQAAGQG